MNDPILHKVLAASARSELVQAVAQVRADGGLTFALGQTKLRSLSSEEIRGLESLGNRAEDWMRLCVARDFDYRRVRLSQFHGNVILGRFSRQLPVADGLELPCGIYQSTLTNCVVGHDALVLAS